ncbi:MAG TPA: hypothetical protein VHZ04_01415 [Candidatus Paceibacterota bacterium]|jgi:hypothetical protein|nr:hypothetical protein [Candidatus Paceibacterota bacterium]
MDRALTVFGYHGTSAESAEAILEPGKQTAERFLFSENDTDWLGKGVYFFQDAPYRSREWPTIRVPPPARTENPVVLCAEIDLKDCLDLLDIEAAKEIVESYPSMEVDYKKSERLLPVNKGGKHEFDCALINYAVEYMEENGRKVNVVRAAFVEGRPILPESQLYSRAHVQIVVRPYRMEAIKDIHFYHFKEGGK